MLSVGVLVDRLMGSYVLGETTMCAEELDCNLARLLTSVTRDEHVDTLSAGDGMSSCKASCFI